MQPKIIRGNKIAAKKYGHTIVYDILNSKNWPYFSVAKVKKIGNDIKLGYDTQSEVVYYVLAGKGKCVINGKEYILQKGDCVIYPKGTPYKHLKGLTLLAIASPRFDRSNRKYVE
jgi:mannose-6-phosphate isomerase-like protein (cupin superfamily)